jgi:malonyl-ACP decarboxylase
MKNYNQSEIIISGVGVTSAIGQGKNAFSSALLQGQHNFAVMKRAGRQVPQASFPSPEGPEQASVFLGAEITDLNLPEFLSSGLMRTASFSAQVALATLQEAWIDANLESVDPYRIGLVVGGSNFQQRELIETHKAFKDRLHFVRPNYAISFMDSDLCGLCTEAFGIKGFAYTVGGASASGQVAIIQAIQAVQSGMVDCCIAVGALMDLSYWECLGFRALGAMGSDRFATQAALACRPFDQDRDGFIYGESCGVVVVEKSNSILRKNVKPYARVSGYAMGMDGNRNPNPSFEGEVRVIQKALEEAKLLGKDIDYVNPHGTGSSIGDETELKALKHCELNHAHLNATKSIIGHGFSAAGTVEVIATLLQMKEAQLHPTRNLERPIESSFNWVRHQPESHVIKNALTLSMGFGGINTAICLQR